ncbi:MAG: dTDP-4-dehydrorhamnose 3,5-epimerase [Bacteroidota bacterium]
MKFTSLELNGLVLIEPKLLSDSRGYFFESWHEKKFAEGGLKLNFVQDNESCSSKGVLRGFHFQIPPYEQGKLVRVIKGAALDVVVDIRKKSPTYGKHYKVVLDDKQRNMLWIPAGFAHGFLSMQDDTVFVYKCTGFYDKASEKGILWNDPDLNIDWGVSSPLVSEKDLELMRIKDLPEYF